MTEAMTVFCTLAVKSLQPSSENSATVISGKVRGFYNPATNTQLPLRIKEVMPMSSSHKRILGRLSAVSRLCAGAVLAI